MRLKNREEAIILNNFINIVNKCTELESRRVHLIELKSYQNHNSVMRQKFISYLNVIAAVTALIAAIGLVLLFQFVIFRWHSVPQSSLDKTITCTTDAIYYT